VRGSSRVNEESLCITHICQVTGELSPYILKHVEAKGKAMRREDGGGQSEEEIFTGFGGAERK
jgi:hypothetical protein